MKKKSIFSFLVLILACILTFTLCTKSIKAEEKTYVHASLTGWKVNVSGNQKIRYYGTGTSNGDTYTGYVTLTNGQRHSVTIKDDGSESGKRLISFDFGEVVDTLDFFVSKEEFVNTQDANKVLVFDSYYRCRYAANSVVDVASSTTTYAPASLTSASKSANDTNNTRYFGLLETGMTGTGNNSEVFYGSVYDINQEKYVAVSIKEIGGESGKRLIRIYFYDRNTESFLIDSESRFIYATGGTIKSFAFDSEYLVNWNGDAKAATIGAYNILSVEGGTGSGYYFTDASATVTATVENGYRFVKWVDEEENEVSTSNPYTFTITSNIALKAVTEEIPYNVTVENGTGSGEYKANTEVTVTATIPNGYRFVKWVDEDDNQVSTDSEYTFIVTENTSLKAILQKTYSLEVENGSGAGTYDENTSVTVTATIPENYKFVNWVDEEENEVSTEVEYSFNITSDTSLKAIVVEKTKYTINISNGTGTGEYYEGTEITITATVPEDYKFIKWIDEEENEVSTENPYTFIATDNVTYTAVIEETEKKYTLTVNNGTGSGIYTESSLVTITATVENGYKFIKWVDEEENEVSTENPYTFNILCDTKLTAITEEIFYNITIENGTGQGKYKENADVSVNAEIPSGYRFDKWVDIDNVEVSKDPLYSFKATSDITLKAIFVKVYSVTFENETTTYDENTSITLTATVDEGYRFVKWVDEEENEVSTENPYTFTLIKDISLKAITIEQFKLVVTDGNNSGTYDKGTSITVTANIKNCYKFIKWVDEEENEVSTENPYTFNLLSNTTLKAIYEEDPKTVIITITGTKVRPSATKSRFEVSAENIVVGDTVKGIVTDTNGVEHIVVIACDVSGCISFETSADPIADCVFKISKKTEFKSDDSLVTFKFIKNYSIIYKDGSHFSFEELSDFTGSKSTINFGTGRWATDLGDGKYQVSFNGATRTGEYTLGQSYIGKVYDKEDNAYDAEIIFNVNDPTLVIIFPNTLSSEFYIKNDSEFTTSTPKEEAPDIIEFDDTYIVKFTIASSNIYAAKYDKEKAEKQYTIYIDGVGVWATPLNYETEKYTDQVSFANCTIEGLWDNEGYFSGKGYLVKKDDVEVEVDVMIWYTDASLIEDVETTIGKLVIKVNLPEGESCKVKIKADTIFTSTKVGNYPNYIKFDENYLIKWTSGTSIVTAGKYDNDQNAPIIVFDELQLDDMEFIEGDNKPVFTAGAYDDVDDVVIVKQNFEDGALDESGNLVKGTWKVTFTCKDQAGNEAQEVVITINVEENPDKIDEKTTAKKTTQKTTEVNKKTTNKVSSKTDTKTSSDNRIKIGCKNFVSTSIIATTLSVFGMVFIIRKKREE